MSFYFSFTLTSLFARSTGRTWASELKIQCSRGRRSSSENIKYRYLKEKQEHVSPETAESTWVSLGWRDLRDAQAPERCPCPQPPNSGRTEAQLPDPDSTVWSQATQTPTGKIHWELSPPSGQHPCLLQSLCQEEALLHIVIALVDQVHVPQAWVASWHPAVIFQGLGHTEGNWSGKQLGAQTAGLSVRQALKVNSSLLTV